GDATEQCLAHVRPPPRAPVRGVKPGAPAVRVIGLRHLSTPLPRPHQTPRTTGTRLVAVARGISQLPHLYGKSPTNGDFARVSGFRGGGFLRRRGPRRRPTGPSRS